MVDVSPADGTVRWTFDLREEVGQSGIHGAMLTDAETIYFPSDVQFLWAVDRRTGRERWRATTEAVEKRGGFPTDLLRDGPLIITITSRDELVAFDAANGAQKWRQQLDPSGPDRRSSAAVENHRVWAVSGETLVSFDSSDGHLRSRVLLGSTASTSVATGNGFVYVGLEDGTIVSVRDGAIAKRFHLVAPAFGKPAIIGTSILLLTRAAEVVALDGTLSKQLWRRTAKEWGSPEVESWRGLALAATSEGDIFALDPATGKVEQTWHVPGYVRGIGWDDRHLYAGTLSGDVFALALDDTIH